MQKSVQAKVNKDDRYVNNAFKYIFWGLWTFFTRKKMHSGASTKHFMVRNPENLHGTPSTISVEMCTNSLFNHIILTTFVEAATKMKITATTLHCNFSMCRSSNLN